MGCRKCPMSPHVSSRTAKTDSTSAVLNPIPIPESILKKRKTADQNKADRATALAERKQVSSIFFCSG